MTSVGSAMNDARRLIVSRADLAASWPDLRAAAVIGLDLRDERIDWSEGSLDGAAFFGCVFAPGVSDVVTASGAATFSVSSELPFEPYRAELYRYDELTSGHERGVSESLDLRISSWFTASSPTSLPDLAVRALHDATIDAAVARLVDGHRVVGVMGGHDLPRDAELYRTVAQLGRALTREGFLVATGGGPGVMEAANLGAWFAPFDDDQLEAAIGILADAPIYSADRERYIDRALDVGRRWAAGGESLGVPTWVYLDEPTTGFATHIAKYFTNSIRENGLLAIARSGVVYAPGGPGTTQEIFTDTAQNSLTLYSVRSPMVFLGRRFFEADRPELVAAARTQAAAAGWEELISVCDDPLEAVAFITAHDPDSSGAGPVERRRAHVDG
jgi:predicted Rossmann-fold nucleotide-binding protein